MIPHRPLWPGPAVGPSWHETAECERCGCAMLADVTEAPRATVCDRCVLAALLSEARISENPYPADYKPGDGHILSVATFDRALSPREARIMAAYWREQDDAAWIPASVNAHLLTDTVSTYTDEAGHTVTFHGVRGSYTPK